MILYEYPFNERIRTYLRLEQLFRRLAELVAREHPLDHHFAIQTLFELTEVASRSDLKADLMKDLERHKQVLNGYRGNPAIAEAALDQFIAKLDDCFGTLNADAGRVGHSLTSNDWLMTIRNRMGIPGGTCGFDLPSYHDWQHHPVESRRQDLGLWSQELGGVANALQMLMKLLRDTGMPQKTMATGGQLQQQLPPGRSFQLLRLRIERQLDVIPEITGNRLLFSVRLMRRGEDGRLQACDVDAPVEVTLCS